MKMSKEEMKKIEITNNYLMNKAVYNLKMRIQISKYKKLWNHNHLKAL